MKPVWMRCISRAMFGWLLFQATAVAQAERHANEVKVRFEVRLNAEAAADTDLFLAGNQNQLGNWRPAGLKLEKQSAGVYVAEARFAAGTQLEFKVTQGSWLTVEKDQDGEDIENRRLRVGQDPSVDAGDSAAFQKCEVMVSGWGRKQPLKNTVQGNLHLLEPNSHQGGDLDRKVAVWLPPGYEQTDARYPVFYLHDGQNLFDSATSAFGSEWQIDETATRLIEQGKIEPLIIVGIWNTPDRIKEYTPSSSANPAEEKQSAVAEDNDLGGDRYLSFLVETIKPMVDKTYRTRPERESTAIGGSSLGGLISLYAGVKHQDVFSGYAVISPSLGWKDEEFLKRLEAEQHLAENFKEARVWIDMGTREGSTAHGQQANVERTHRLVKVMNRIGLDTEDEIRHQVVSGGQHNEKAWAERFGSVLEFLFPQASKK